ncbi:MAG: hypothetical protein AAF515_01740 [Pseudomonadota bacterium]
MSDYPIVDCHIHPYQSAKIGLDLMGGVKEYGYDGSIEDTFVYMKDHNISHCVILNYLPVGQMEDRAMETMAYGLQGYAQAAR